MKTAITIIVVVVIVGVAVVIAGKRRGATPELTPGETKIRDAVREVYAGNIVTERIERDGSDAVFVVELQNETLLNLEINLSSLARKHEQEGLSIAAIKMSLRFD